jgi:hypothetical protein
MASFNHFIFISVKRRARRMLWEICWGDWVKNGQSIIEEEEETPTNDDGDDESDGEVSSSEFESDGGHESVNKDELPEVEDLPWNKCTRCMALKEAINILFLQNEFLKISKKKCWVAWSKYDWF